MTQAGFVEVESRLLTLPLSGWSSGTNTRAISANEKQFTDGLQTHETEPSEQLNRANVHQLLSSLAMYPFTQHLG